MGNRHRHDTHDPRAARTRALKILFQADVRGVSGEVALGRLVDDARGRAILDDLDLSGDAAGAEASGTGGTGDGGETSGTSEAAVGDGAGDAPAATGGSGGEDLPATAPALDGFTRQLVLGVSDHLEEIDGLIGRHARSWSVDRMPVVDRTVLRLATYELLYEVTSAAVVINEALELAKSLSTEASGRYVNGVLEAIRKDVAARREQDRPGA